MTGLSLTAAAARAWLHSAAELLLLQASRELGSASGMRDRVAAGACQVLQQQAVGHAVAEAARQRQQVVAAGSAHPLALLGISRRQQQQAQAARQVETLLQHNLILQQLHLAIMPLHHRVAYSGASPRP